MLTVLHTESSRGWGGQENRTLHEAVGLRKLGARVIILCPPDSILRERASAKGLDVRTRVMKKGEGLTSIKYILGMIKAENIDIISTHSGRDSFLAGTAGRLSAKRPAIVRTRHLALPITSSWGYRIFPHVVVTVSEYVRQYLAEVGVAPDKIVAVPTGIDLDIFDPAKHSGRLRDELGLKPDVPVIGTVGILRRKKGHSILLDAAPLILKEEPEAVFVFAGNGPQRENIRAKIAAMGLSRRVFMLGLRNDVPDILKSIDLFVLPTLQEALGTSFIEAMAIGKPVVGTTVGGVGEVIRDGLNGYAVAPDNPGELAVAVIRLLKDRDKARAMGLEGRRMALRKYGVDRMCESMYGLYSELVTKRRGNP